MKKQSAVVKAMADKPLVSIIMPVYNGSRFVEKAIESSLKQTYHRFELIIVDDGSTDNTWKILQTYKKICPNIIRIYRLKKNKGESVAANLAYAKAKGSYIARFDSDDIMDKTRIAKQIEYMLSHPSTITLGTQARVINARGYIIGHKKTPLTHEKIYNSFGFINPMVHPSVMFRRSLLPKRECLYKSNFESTDDYHTYFELLNYGRFDNLAEELVSYRIHGANKSLTNMKEKFWTDTKVRISAVSTMNYQAPTLMFPAIAIQALIVTLLPEKALRELFYYIRGIKKITFHIKFPAFFPTTSRTTAEKSELLFLTKLKSYATNLLA